MHLDRRAFIGFTGASAACSLILFGRSGGAAPSLHFAVNHTPAEWQKILGPLRYTVLREAATERPFTSPLLHEKRHGIFGCAGCRRDLFSSATKFDSGSGWPSFWDPLEGAVGTIDDKTFGMVRTAVHCSRCGGHLGHVLDDGPRPTGLRYCINGLALIFSSQVS